MRALALLVLIAGCVSSPLHAQTSRPGVVVTPGSPTTAGTPPVTLGSISGRVTAADTGRPLRRARVTLTPPQGPPRVVTTGVDGAFTFTELPEGSYQLAAGRPGYVRIAHGQTRPLEQGQPIQVRNGQPLTGLNFALPPMSTITGRILDETGEPFPGVYVLALAPAYADGQRQWLPSGEATTDDRGQYTLADLMPGTYLVMATLNATWTIREEGVERVHGYASTYLPGSLDIVGASRLTVGLGQRQNAPDFALIPGRMTNISGTVVNSRGEPSSGETVYVSRVIRTATGISRIEQGGSVVERDGSFLIRNLAPGDYVLAVRDVETQPTMHVEEATVVPITAGGEAISDLQIVTSAAWSIEGVFRSSSGELPPRVFGSVRETGSVTSISTRTTEVVAMPADLVTNRRIGGAPPSNGMMVSGGGFRLDNLFGPMRLGVNFASDSWMLERIEHQGRDITDQIVEMGSRQTLRGVEVFVTDRVTQLTASVTDARGQPVTGGTVIVFPTNRDRWGNRSRFVRAARPDQFGVVDFRRLPPEDYLVAALEYVPDGAWFDPDFLAEASLRAERVSIDSGERATITLRPR